MLALIGALVLVAVVVRALMRPLPAEAIKSKRIKTFSRVPWSPKEIEVPVSRKPSDKG